MKKGRSVLILLILCIGTIGLASAVSDTSQEPSNTAEKASQEGTASVATPVTKGTKQFLNKRQSEAKRMTQNAENFPYDMEEAVAWVRDNRISLPDPISKKSLLVSLLSDAQIKAYLLRPAGRRLIGLDNAGLGKKKSAISLVPEGSGRRVYGLSSVRQDLDKKFIGPGQSGKKELPYYLAQSFNRGEIGTPPQSGNLGEEFGWVRANLQTMYDPFKKQTLRVTRVTEEYLKYLLKAPEVRKNIGLPPLGAGAFSKNTRY